MIAKKVRDSLIDQFALRIRGAGILIEDIDSAPWIDALEQDLPKRLPPSFSSLVRRYRFAPFEWGPLFFFGNSSSERDRGYYPAAVLRDRFMWNTMLKAGFIQFARPAGGSYDAICFDARVPGHNREFAIVRLDHESILIRERIDVREKMARSFFALTESLLGSQTEPVAFRGFPPSRCQ